MSRRARRRLPALALAATGALLLAGCTDGGDAEPADEPAAEASAQPSAETSSSADAPSAAGPGEQASAYPAPASASPSPLPDLGTRRAGDLTLTLNAVRRASPDAVVVEATLAASSNIPLFDLAEPGFKLREVDGEQPNTYEFSAVTLAAPGDPQVYLPLRDDQGSCACTQGIQFLDGGQTMGVYTYVTAPDDASTVTVNVTPFAPFPDVRVTG